MAKKIVTLDQQRHLFQSLSEIFKEQTPAEISDIIKSLGIDSILGNDGGLAPVYSLDILSNKPVYVVNDFDIQLTGKVYNYFTDATSKVTKWQWERISGNADEDAAWKVGKTSKILNLKVEDFTSRFKENDIIFKLSATIGNTVVTDEIKFSRFLYFSQVQIIKDGSVFVQDEPETITFTWDSNAEISEVRWYVDDVFRSSADTFVLRSSDVSVGSAATVRLEATEAVTGETFTDSETVVRVSNGIKGEDGVKGQSVLTSIVFKRSENKPNTPGLGEGDFYNPVPATWSDGIPPELNGWPVWTSTRVFTSDGKAPQGAWSEPEVTSDTATVDFDWSNYDGDDLDYLGTPDTRPELWNEESSVENVWMAVQRTVNGEKQPWTINRIKGEKGQASYTWVKYAHDNLGTGMSDYPVDNDGTVREFIGILTGQSVEEESENPADYKWVKYIGEDGIPGDSVVYTYVFKRSEFKPTTPGASQGTFLNPVPTGWSDSIPDELNGWPVWMTSRIFTLSGNAPQTLWSEPQITSDTSTLDIDWSSYDGEDMTVLGNPDTKPGMWKETSSPGDTYMAMQHTINGEKQPWTISRIKGEKGEPSYTWIKYSEFPNGRDTTNKVSMYDCPRIFIECGCPNTTDCTTGTSKDLGYMGISTNNLKSTESNNPEDYTWSKVRGNDGASNYVLELDNDNTSVASGSNGGILDPATAFLHAKTGVKLYYGSKEVPITDYSLELIASTGVTYTANIEKTQVQITGLTADSGTILFKAHPKSGNTVDNNTTLASATFSIIKVKGNATYDIIVSSPEIRVTSTGTVTPDNLTVKVLKHTGAMSSYTTQGTLTYRYIFDSNINTVEDGTPMIVGGNHKVDKTGNPRFIEFKYFSPDSGEIVDIERVSFARDGVDGQNADNPEMRFQKNTTSTIIPAVDKDNPNPSGWSVTQPEVGPGEVLWMIRTVKKPDGTLRTPWSTPIIFIGLPGAPGKDGAPGISGTVGPSPRTFEWVPGATYQIGAGFYDYVYYRGTGSNDPCLGWYTPKLPNGKTISDYNTAAFSVVANDGCPDPNLFVKAPFSNTQTFGTVIAEQANLAGFLFRNQVLKSQAEVYQSCTNLNDRGPFPNMTIDGINGILKFSERIILVRDGIYFKDDCGRNRLKISNDVTGAPVIQFFYEDGKKAYYIDQDGPIASAPGNNSAWRVVKGVNTNPNRSIPTNVLQRVVCKCNQTLNFFGNFVRTSNVLGYEYMPRGDYRDPNYGKVYTTPDINGALLPEGSYVTGVEILGGDWIEIIVSHVNSSGIIYNLSRTEVYKDEILNDYNIYNCGVGNTPSCV